MPQKTGNYKPDFYAQRAKQEGYAARSVFKLEEIHKKYLHKLSRAKKILDLGAAPGSWSQYLQKQVPLQAEIIAIDTQEIHANFSDKPKITFIQADFTYPHVVEELIALGPYNYIMSDAAPLTTGNKGVDSARSEILVETTIYIAERSLVPDGTLVAKLFQGSGTASLLQELRRHYKKVVAFRPNAVKSSSFETYLVCYLGQK